MVVVVVEVVVVAGQMLLLVEAEARVLLVQRLRVAGRRAAHARVAVVQAVVRGRRVDRGLSLAVDHVQAEHQRRRVVVVVG